TVSCSGGAGNKVTSAAGPGNSKVTAPPEKLINMVTPEINAKYKLYDNFNVVLSIEQDNAQPDSVSVYFDGRLLKVIKSAPWECPVSDSVIVKTGRKAIKAVAYRQGKQQNTVTRFITVLSDIAPKMYGYRVVHTYPHDRDAFTQGLVYDDGYLYEGTGQESGSSLRKVDLTTGKVLMQHNLEASLFGEGISILGNRIYEVTWQNKVGFVYRKSDFELINKIYYGTEGWGLTTIGNRLVMSDGSNVLYFYEPEMFTVVSRIEVYDNREKVDSLNELEYINGEIWANIWMSDLIARIDPTTGEVISYVNMKGLLPEADRQPDTDVLNGIAYDKKGNRIFVTGKRWPKLFEIKVTE
ncbi:MAG TPA: glutaminyl-peptide cyclotransferase, partial [Bacteroidales bacterium]|nr:glutaminyl-peptide cyclotransferase [Bacteroidales bacterium]